MIELKIFVSSLPRRPGTRSHCAGDSAAPGRVFSALAALALSLGARADAREFRRLPENIAAPADFDVFLCLLWSRLGSRLGSKHRTHDGKTFPSGTVYEFENALAAAHSPPPPSIRVAGRICWSLSKRKFLGQLGLVMVVGGSRYSTTVLGRSFLTVAQAKGDYRDVNFDANGA